jgi:hypothetical protein
LCISTVILGLLIAAAPPEAVRFTPTADYQSREVCGVKVLVHPEVRKHPDEADLAFEELEAQLKRLEDVVPQPALAELKKVRIWIEWEAKPNGAAEFHVSKDWLVEHGYNPEKEKSVEINNCRNFVKWSRDGQPWMMMHELAHAYHHRALKHKHEKLDAAFQHAVDEKLYESVAYFRSDEKRKAYAITNVDEYFAELTESYFGRNDFYPFQRAELKQHDPRGFAALEEIWNGKK